MKKAIAAALLFLISFSGIASDYEEAWKEISKKNFTKAKSLLLKATKDLSRAMDAYMSLLYLQTYLGDESHIPGLSEELMGHKDRNAYLFASWFNGAVLGPYSKKQSHQLKLLDRVINSGAFNGSIVSAAHYVKAMHYQLAAEYSKARQEWKLTDAIEDWQLAGPFENLSGSGFNVNHGPLNSPSEQTRFKAMNDIEVNWFKPLRTNREGWLFLNPHFSNETAIIYAQTFVYSPEDRKVLLNIGCNGSIKAWVNDGLVIGESVERTTELDYYKNYCQLKKGYNRILIQLGYHDNSTPNFIVRITDDKFNALTDLKVVSSPQEYSKSAAASKAGSLKHFAEKTFEENISSEPGNLINYILLSQAYLRNQRVFEARQVIEKALKMDPDNSLLRFELIQALIKDNNRTLLLQELDWLKENDANSYINLQLSIQNLMDEEKYKEAEEELNKMVSLYTEDETMLNTRIQIFAKLNKVEELLSMVETAYKKYPEHSDFIFMKYNVEKLINKDKKSAMGIFQKYLKSNFNFKILATLADEYKEQGSNKEYLRIIESLYDQNNYAPRIVNLLSKHYFEKRDFNKSLQYALEATQLAPYEGNVWENVALIYESMGEKAKAIEHYKKAIYYDRTNYDARKKLSLLEDKPELYKMLPDPDAYDLIKKSALNKEFDYHYVLDEKGVIVYDIGASEEYIAYAIKINTEKGIDNWKEIYLPYNGSQSMLIEKVEVVKANGTKLPAERNENHVVFPNLEVGDAVYVKYRLQNYSSGRLGKELYDHFVLNAFVPSSAPRYTLIVPKDFEFNWHLNNNNMKPVIETRENLKIYTWQLDNPQPLKYEPLMPPMSDVGTVLHISTIKSWAEIANWYADLSFQDVSENIELQQLYDSIFGGVKGKLNQMEKARMIYNYIVTNIRYSSVSFRQSGLKPQSISRIISTRLGDCKDLSILFVELAKKAGIPAQLVLIDTRDNGLKDMILPSMAFNHCIALAKIDGKDYYLELTDGNLPFGSLGNNLTKALSLIVPPHGTPATSELKPLVAANKTQEKINRNIQVSINGRDVKMDVVVKRFGNLTSGWRTDYKTLTADKQKEEFEQTLNNNHKNPIELESVSFKGLDKLEDSLITNYKYTIRNEVAEAGSMRMLKIPFIDLIATLENFGLTERKFQLEYWKYENTDQYETTVTVHLPAGQKFIEIPSNTNLSFKGCSYSLKYIPEGNKLRVVRVAKLNRDNILPEDYPEFRKFFNNIVEAEGKYLVFK